VSRWLAVDFGHKRVGFATGDTEDGFALPCGVYTGPTAGAVDAVVAKMDEMGAGGLVVGLPINMDHTIGPQAEKTLVFARELAAATPVEVRVWDERLSSFQADEQLAGHLTRKKRRARQDGLAAAVILNDFFQNDGPTTASRVSADPPAGEI
jgi:putative Holliday junction resolvase